MSIAKKFRNQFTQNRHNENFCYASLVRRVTSKSVLRVKHGGDDILHSFCDGSKLLERTIVRELQLFKE